MCACLSVVGAYFIFVMLICAASLGMTMWVLYIYHYEANHSRQMPQWVSSP